MDQNLNQEQEAKQAVQEVMPQQKKPGRMAVQIFAIAVLLGLVGYGVYAWQNNRVAKLETQVADLKKSNETPAPTKTADPYAGWSSYTAKYEQFSFKYPSDFTITAANKLNSELSTGGYENVTLTGPKGFTMRIQTGLYGVGGGCENCGVDYSIPVTIAGDSYHLNFVNDDQSQKLVGHIIVGQKADAYLDFMKGKTILTKDVNGATLISIGMGYDYSVQKGTYTPQVLTTFKADANVATAQKILESLSY